MEPVSIYIVDDEQMAITYLKYLLDRIPVPGRIAGESTNSVRALQEISGKKPDIVFLDINMPVMDGLTLAEEILKKCQPRIFLLTSYRDFDFVKRGIQIGVTDYILKNDLTEESLSQILEKAIEELAQDRKQRHLILEHNVRQFLMDPDNQSEMHHIYENRPLQRYAMIGIYSRERIILIPHGEAAGFPADCYEMHALKTEKGLTCSAFTETAAGEIYGVYFVHGDVPDGQEILKKQAEHLRSYMEAHGLKCRFVISRTSKNFLDLPSFYKEMHRLKDYLYKEDNCLHLQQELEKETPADMASRIEELRERLLSRIEEDPERSDESLQELLDYCIAHENVWEYTESLRILLRILREKAKKNQTLQEKLRIPNSFADVQEAANSLEIICRQLTEGERREERHSYSPYVEKAMEYIRENYQKDLAVAEIAEAAGVSEGHLRRLFRQEMGSKVIDYLMDYRLECAKAMMKRGHTSVSEVWQSTGFTSAQYFSYVFKKKEGVLPKDYIRGKGN